MLRKLIVLSLLSLLYINNAQALTLKISTLSTDGSSWMNELRAGASEIEQRTEGRVKFKFYPGGVMGDDQAVLRKIRFGQLHGATFTNGSLTSIFLMYRYITWCSNFATWMKLIMYVKNLMKKSLQDLNKVAWSPLACPKLALPI